MISSQRCQSSPLRMRLAMSSLLVVSLASGRGHWFWPLAAALEYAMLASLSERFWRWVAAEALIVSMLVSMLAVLQICLGLPRARGPFASPNFLGYYAVAHVFLALAWTPLLPRLAPAAMWSSAIAVALSGS